MDDEILTPESLTPSKLYDILSRAQLNPAWTTSHVRDYDIEIWEPHRIYVVLSDDGYDIQLRSFFDLRSEASLADRYLYVNQVNCRVAYLCACIWDHDKLEFSYYLGVDGGLFSDALVRTIRRFFTLIDKALAEDLDDVIEKQSLG